MNSIIGHEIIISNLKNSILSNSIGHAYMFSGIYGVGKYYVAREFAKSIICLDTQDGTYCGKCESCMTFGTIDDFIEVFPEENGMIKVDAIRKLIDSIMIKPAISTHKVVLIRDAEGMNESAQNALLKILEEPPSYATIILVTNNKEKIIPTIKSRCTAINFSPLKDDEIRQIVKDSINEGILPYASGSVGKYYKIQNSNYLEEIFNLEKIFDSKDLLFINSAISSLKQYKNLKIDINDILDLLIVRLSKRLNEGDILKKSTQIETIEEIRNNILRNANLDLQLDYLGLRIWQINS